MTQRLPFTLTVLGLALIGACESSMAPATRPQYDASGVDLIVSGAGHLDRDLGGGPELSTFSYNAVRRASGETSGQYQYDFRAAGFSIHGSVTCVSATGNAAWIGGVIDLVKSPDPADQALVGTEIWWRVIDHGQGAADPADETTSLLFAIPGLQITAASWCQNQDVRGVMRPIEEGNIQVNAH